MPDLDQEWAEFCREMAPVLTAEPPELPSSPSTAAPPFLHSALVHSPPPLPTFRTSRMPPLRSITQQQTTDIDAQRERHLNVPFGIELSESSNDDNDNIATIPSQHGPAGERRQVLRARRAARRQSLASGLTVYIHRHERALVQAESDSELPLPEHLFVFWTDGSVFHHLRRFGASVVYPQRGSTDMWRAQVAHGTALEGRVYRIQAVEGAAIRGAFAAAVQQLDAVGGAPPGCRVCVYSDSIIAIRAFMRTYTRRDAEVVDAVERLEVRGAKVELRWVPAHRRVSGNIVADRWAKNAALMGDRCAAATVHGVELKGLSVEVVEMW